MEEKRAWPRQKGRLPARLIHNRFGTIAVETDDVADGGVYIRAESGVPVPDLGDELRFMLEGFMGTPPREVRAQVVRVDSEGFAISFLESPFED